jgi:hypothetical protein
VKAHQPEDPARLREEIAALRAQLALGAHRIGDCRQCVDDVAQRADLDYEYAHPDSSYPSNSSIAVSTREGSSFSRQSKN